MSTSHFLKRLACGPQDARHLSRLCLFAGAGGLQPAQHEQLCISVRQKLNMDDASFQLAMKFAEQWWSEKIEAMDEKILACQDLTAFRARMEKKRKPKGISTAKASLLMARLLCLVLQTVSIQTGKNHLKSRDLRQLLSLIHTRHIEEVLEKPFEKALAGKVEVTSERFVLRMLFFVRLLAEIYQAQCCDEEWIKADFLLRILTHSGSFSPEQIREYLHRPPQRAFGIE